MEFEQFFDDDLISQEPANHSKESTPSFARPRVKNLETSENDICFQTIDIDSYNCDTPRNITTKYSEYGSTLRIYGVTLEGNSILVNCYGFRPYLWVEAPGTFDENYVPKLQKSLNEYILKSHNSDKNVKTAILSIEMENKTSIYGFSKNGLKPFFKITVATVSLISTCKKCLEDGFTWEGEEFSLPYIFESNINFEIRFMVDVALSGCNWIKLKSGTYNRIENCSTSNCQIEADIGWTDLEVLADDKYDSIAPYRILSYDIECSGRKGIFPEATVDPVIQIANTLTIYGYEEKVIKVVFTLGSCAPIVGAYVKSYKTEEQMLKSWAEFIITVDPDIITGYNILNFDTPYLIERAQHLKIKEILSMGRIKSEISRVRITTFQSQAFGRRDNKAVNISGRLQLDVFQILLREHKLRSYTLNNASFHFLGEQKEDVAYSIITELQNGDEYTRRRLAVYCIKDSYLPIKLLNKLMILTNQIEMSRVTGVPLNFLLTRGQQVKVISQLLRTCKQENMLIPTMNATEKGQEFEGATVIEPVKGYYDVPIATLDFVSLYPSIMICHNLCYSTLLTPAQAKAMKPEDYTLTPCGNYFVKKHIKKGILPYILKNLLDARKHVKFLLKTEKDPLRRKVYDGRQLAIKLSANSVYGFTGAQVGRLPCLEISGSVTAFGRTMIEQTKEVVENKYNCKNGYTSNSRVIYGDTDSVMIKFGISDISETMQLANEAAQYVSSQFPDPIKLEFEKIYLPYLLISKKRYAGLLYTNPLKYDRIDCKGIETVRRDNCLLVANLVSSSLYKILIGRDPNGAIKDACQSISDLLMNRIDISMLIITKELRKTGEDYSNKQPHSELAERMKKRDPGSAPKLGDRVPFVYIMGSKKDRAYEKAEDPMYVLENNIPIDTNYYLVNQLSKPLTRLFKPILKEKTLDTLLKGEHTLNKSMGISSVGLLNKFATKKQSCMGCKSTIESNGKIPPLSSALCSYCDENFASIYLNEVNKLKNYQERCNLLWTECQRCQGSYVEEVICTNRDCPIFYMRTKVLKDVENQSKNLERFRYLTDSKNK